MKTNTKKKTTFAQEEILKGAERKKHDKSNFQDTNCRFDETYTEYDDNKYDESYGETYTVHDEGVGY